MFRTKNDAMLSRMQNMQSKSSTFTGSEPIQMD